ncbi:MAG TPA: vWA domain-containing protein [Oligoflexia bacterium]|nr:vWA domain-containing protein [Oligoflexia bacterium]
MFGEIKKLVLGLVFCLASGAIAQQRADIVILVDVSGSIAYIQKSINIAKTIAQDTCISQKPDGSRVAVLGFGQTVNTLYDFSSSSSEIRENWNSSWFTDLYEEDEQSQTFITPALNEAELLLENSEGRHKIIIVVSDGMFDDRNAMILERAYLNTTGIGVVAVPVPIQTNQPTYFNEYEPDHRSMQKQQPSLINLPIENKKNLLHLSDKYKESLGELQTLIFKETLRCFKA